LLLDGIRRTGRSISLVGVIGHLHTATYVTTKGAITTFSKVLTDKERSIECG
jgi:short-subunit dehydrogenase